MMERDFIFGIRAVIEAIDSNKTINKLLIQKGLNNELMRELSTKIGPIRHLVQYVPLQKLNLISRKNHQGVIAFISPIEYLDIEEIITRVYEEGETPFLLMLDRITDVRNFGAIARTAECMGVHAIITPAKGAAMVNGDAVKTSAGALTRIPVCRERFLDRTLETLQQHGIKSVACTEKTEKTLKEGLLTGPLCIVMGSEEDGVSEGLLKLCDDKLKIPMSGTIASLNVSVACGMILYEASQQRTA